MILLTGLFFLLGTIMTFAQVKEVKGVTSRIACYDNCEKQYDSEKTYGFEYENFNSFAVTIEAEKWRNGFGRTSGYPDFLAETKTFILQPGEKYVWKVEMQGTVGDYSPNLGHTPLAKEGFYTKFKAFKNE